MNDPLVSVYIPTRGRPNLLRRALGSALCQTYSAIEVLVAVDGPDSDTHDALAPFASDPRVRIIARESQGGACRARNDAIRAARGELITGLDDDDELRPDHLRSLVDLLLQSGAPFVATSNLILRPEGPIVRHAFSGPITLDSLLSENVVGNQVLTRTAYLRELGGFDPTMPAWQDYDLWVRLAARYGTGFKTDSRSYLQHQEHGAERISDGARIKRAHARFVEKHARLLQNSHLMSIELLMLATTHEPFAIPKLFRLAQGGLGKRAVIAYLSNRLPRLRRRALGLKRRLSRLRF